MNEADGDDALVRTVDELADRLTTGTAVSTLGEQLSTVVTVAAELLQVESVGILLLDDADRVRCAAATGRAAEALERAQERIVVGPGIDALTGRDVVAVADLADEPRYEPLWQEIAGHGIRAVLAAPVRLDGQVVGNLNALDPEPHVWSGAPRRAAEACAAIVGQLLGLAAHGVGASVERNGRGPVR